MKRIVQLIILVTSLVFTSLFTYGATGVIIEGSTMVPARGVFEALGFDVEWKADDCAVVIKDNNYVVVLQEYKGDVYVADISTVTDINDVEFYTVYSDLSVRRIGGSIYLPLRTVADCVGANISWDASTKTAHISYNGKDVYVNCNQNKNIPNFVGTWTDDYSGRCHLTIKSLGGNAYDMEIVWGSSAYEYEYWHMTGSYDSSKNIIRYNRCYRNTVYDDGSRELQYKFGEGEFKYSNGRLYCNSYNDSDLNNCCFIKD